MDQTRLPHEFEIIRLATCADAARAIRDMQVRGAPLIGATAAYGMALAMREDASDAALEKACVTLLATRPTAVNLRWALDNMRAYLLPLSGADRIAGAYRRAAEINDEDVAINRQIGEHGVALLRNIS
ncbi:MAG: S-methyl-5-thioribose-1-phosphate isomerase, partial [Alphaproteobacteria bacterium]